MISNLQPLVVWKYFEEILMIPRPSKKEERILTYLKEFAEKNQLAYRMDEVENIVICKPATAGREDRPVTILQSHVDMVTEKNGDVEFDFETSPINAYIDEGWIKAKGTTLGADCGIGMAIALAVLASDSIEHPAIEALFTVDEETGMTGARFLDETILTGSYLINLDSEDEGEVFIGCAGGIDTVAYFPVKDKIASKDMLPLRMSVSGLQGGHSGDDIHRGYANSNRLLARFFFENRNKFSFEIASIDGGNLRNAIPRETECLFNLPSTEYDLLQVAFKEFESTLRSESESVEPEMVLSLELMVQPLNRVWEESFASELIEVLVSVPNGVVAMSTTTPGFVETSTNLASVKLIDGSVVVVTSQRSSVESQKLFLADVMGEMFRKYGATIEQSDGYPGWAPRSKSLLLEVFKDSYSELFNKEIAVKAVHAGLECGLILEKYPDLEMVSVGPTIRRVHSPDEKLEIITVEMFWDLMIDVLKRL